MCCLPRVLHFQSRKQTQIQNFLAFIGIIQKDVWNYCTMKCPVVTKARLSIFICFYWQDSITDRDEDLFCWRQGKQGNVDILLYFILSSVSQVCFKSRSVVWETSMRSIYWADFGLFGLAPHWSCYRSGKLFWVKTFRAQEKLRGKPFSCEKLSTRCAFSRKKACKLIAGLLVWFS